MVPNNIMTIKRCYHPTAQYMVVSRPQPHLNAVVKETTVPRPLYIHLSHKSLSTGITATD